jgi:predicted small lipoprotein YifL
MNKNITRALTLFIALFVLASCGAKTDKSVLPGQNSSQYQGAAQWTNIAIPQKDGFTTATGASNRK